MDKQHRETKIQKILDILNIKYKDISFYVEAFTHRSYLNDNKGEKLSHNERLEFLGDAVLELIISEFLYSKFTNRPEGELTSFRAALVKTESLAHTAKVLGFGEYLFLSRGEDSTGGREKDYLLANSFESLLGAIYLDLGYEISKKFVHSHLIPKLDNIVTNRLDIDSKTRFQELAQEKLKETPIYRVISEIGPDHDKNFIMAVLVNNKEYGRGEGSSKQRAEEDAAKNALINLK